MNLVLHFFRKDLRHAKWGFCIWALLIISEGTLALLAYPTKGPNFSVHLGLQLLLPLGHFLFLAVIVPLVIQEDAMVGSAAFWLTRPVSRSQLLRAKLLGLAVIVFVPQVVCMVVVLIAGLPTAQLGAASADILLRQVCFVVPIAAVAALTPTFWRFTAVLVGTATLLTLLSAALPPEASIGAAPRSLPTGLADAVLFMWGVSVLAHQYLTRRTTRSMLLACVGGAIVVAVSVWPWNSANEPAALSTTAFDPNNLTLEVKATHLNTSSTVTLFYNVVVTRIDGMYELAGLPPALFSQTRSVSARIIIGGSTELPSRVTDSTIPPAEFDSPSVPAIAAAIGIPIHSTDSRAPSTTLASLGNSDFVRYRNSPVKLICDLDFVVSRYETDGELPIAKGAHFGVGGERVTIGGIDQRDDGITIEIARSSVNVRFSDQYQIAGRPTELRSKGDYVYVLVNRRRNEAAVVNHQTNWKFAFQPYLGGLLMKKVFELPFGGGQVAGAPIINAEWLQGAVLVRLVRVPVAEFTKRVEVKLPKLSEPLPQPKSPKVTASLR